MAYIPKVIFPQVMDLWILEIPISRREAPMAEVKRASKAAWSAAERAAAGVRGRSPRKNFELFVHYIPPRGTFGNKE